jgi:Protein of unknown function (DUF4038)/Putative collagen-binding domain of a collagenase
MPAKPCRGRPSLSRWARCALVLLTLARIPAADAATGFIYPLKVSANHRYLVDQNGTPFRIQGDSAWSLIANLTYAEADAYLSDRLAKGFNTVLVNLIEHKFAVNAPRNRNGSPPFTTTGNFATPNEAYFAFADSIIDLAASKGMVVHLAYIFLGANGGTEGWWSDLTSSSNTQAVCYDFGLYLGNRYKNRKNIVWLVGGDYTPPSNSEGEKRLHKILEGIQAAGATQLHAADWSSPSLSTDVAAFAAAMNVNAVYTYGNPQDGHTYAWGRNGYQRTPALPAYLVETGYEAEGWIAGDRTSIRKYQYWAVLSGATEGIFYGHRDIWEFATNNWWSGFSFGHQPWQSSLNSPGALDAMRLGQVLDSVPWYDLVPSGLAGMKTLVTAGGGSFGGNDYVTAAATPSGHALVAYLPPTGTAPRSITVDMTALSYLASARWFNPATGAWVVVSSSLPNTGTLVFTTPGNNGSGTNDWVLLLEANTPPLAFYTVSPCRLADTRNPPSASGAGGPALSANSNRTFQVTGLCGVPTDARAAALNVIVVGATDVGDLRLSAANGRAPQASVINFASPNARANNAVIPLGANGRIDVRCDMAPASTGVVHFLIDVAGYLN